MDKALASGLIMLEKRGYGKGGIWAGPLRRLGRKPAPGDGLWPRLLFGKRDLPFFRIFLLAIEYGHMPYHPHHFALGALFNGF